MPRAGTNAQNATVTWSPQRSDQVVEMPPGGPVRSESDGQRDRVRRLTVSPTGRIIEDEEA